jgi:hypothetical protein
MKLDRHSLQFAMNDTNQIGDVLDAYVRTYSPARGGQTRFISSSRPSRVALAIRARLARS